MIVQVGPYPEPMGGISIYIKRMKQYLDVKEIPNEVWDLSNINKNIQDVINIKFRYVPFKYLFRRDIDIIHFNICGISYKLYIGLFNRLFFKKRKKILTIHGESKDLFTKNNLVVSSLNSFDAIICVKSGDKEYLYKKGINKPLYEIPAFIFPSLDDESRAIPQYILKFINSKNFIISANASSIQFYDNEDLYGIDMCINLIEKLNRNGENIGMIFCIPVINNTAYFNKLKSIIESKKIKSKFLFVNEKKEIYPIIKRSHIFLRPTNTDGDAVSIREALHYKIPTIASDVVTRPKETILFKTRDLDDLYNKTVTVIENYEKFKEKLKCIEFEDNSSKILEIYKACIR